MKIQTVYKVTSADNCSCLSEFSINDDIKNLLKLQFSTEHWTLPSEQFFNSGIFVFPSFGDAEMFADYVVWNRMRTFRIWEAKAFGVRERKTIIRMVSYLSTENVNLYLSGKVIRYLKKWIDKQTYHVADGVKLVKIVGTETW